VPLIVLFYLTLTITSDAKEIIPFNLVRLGLAHSRGIGIFKSPKFGVSWSLLQPAELLSLNTDLLANFRDLPYGPFKALISLVGSDLAQEIAKTGEVVARPLCKRPSDMVTPGSPFKRMRM
jgi:hypothetical protein